MTKPDAMAPIIGLEATVTGGRTVQAHKRGGKDEARERLIEETTGAIVWLGGVKVINDCVGDPLLKKLFGGNFDVGTDKVLRTPFENFMKKNPPKGAEKQRIDNWTAACQQVQEIKKNPELLAQWKQRFEAQLTHGEPDAPTNPRTHSPKIYFRLDCFIRAAIFRKLQKQSNS